MRRLRLSLLAVQLVGAATLLRSVAYDRWITVLASVLLLAGATAARRGHAWGVMLAFGSAVAFPVAWHIGIAPPWFALVGAVGALPFALSFRAFARFDKGAASLLTIAAALMGTFGAVAWKHLAWSAFEAFPFLLPSVEAQHGPGLLAVIASAALAVRLGRAQNDELVEPTRVRVSAELGGGSFADLEREVESTDAVDGETVRDARSADRGGGSLMELQRSSDPDVRDFSTTNRPVF